MLTYHQHHDIYHCMYRMLSALTMIEGNSVEFSKLRILDFYFSFPNLVTDIQFPRMKGIAHLKNISKSFPAPYEILPDKKRLFSEIGDFQIQAIHILRAKRIIKENEFGIIELDEQISNHNIHELLANSKYIRNDFFVDFVKVVESIPLLGKDGLKRRTGLMEYRYDAI